MKLSKQNKILMSTISVLMIIVIVGITYATFTGSLNINGQGVVRNSSWDIHIVEEGELEPSNTISSSTKVITKPVASVTTISNYSVSLTTPGDSISYRFSIVNEGDYDAKISGFDMKQPSCNGTDSISNVNVCSKLTYTLKYDNGATVALDDMIASKETKTFVLTLTYQEFSNASLLPSQDVEITDLGITINYSQVDKALVKSDGSTPYTYQTYNVGDYLTIHNEGYYVISDNNTYVTLLKENPLTVDEVNLYGGVGTENNHVNKNTNSSVGTAYNYNGYGGLAYYSSPTCGYVNGSMVSSGCSYTPDYKESDIKYVVDAWTIAKFTNNELAIDSTGYKTRLITKEELEGLGFGSITGVTEATDNVPNWIWNSDTPYWTMSQFIPNFSGYVYYLDYDFEAVYISYFFRYNGGSVRPVINVYKTKI